MRFQPEEEEFSPVSSFEWICNQVMVPIRIISTMVTTARITPLVNLYSVEGGAAGTVPVIVADNEIGVGVASGLNSFGGLGPERIIAPIITASTITPANSRPTREEEVILPQRLWKKTLIFTA